jgi:hypothetical protein
MERYELHGEAKGIRPRTHLKLDMLLDLPRVRVHPLDPAEKQKPVPDCSGARAEQLCNSWNAKNVLNVAARAHVCLILYYQRIDRDALGVLALGRLLFIKDCVEDVKELFEKIVLAS